MKTNYFLAVAGFLTLLSSSVSFGFTNTCALKDQPLRAQGLSEYAVWAYQQKLIQECAVYQKYIAVRAKAETFSLNLEQITLYQALRYIDRSSLVTAAQQNMPVELIYQKSKIDAAKAIPYRSSLVWNNWVRGVKQLESAMADIKAGVQIDLPYLEKIHIGFFYEDESGEFGDVNKPGTLKTFSTGIVSWPISTAVEAQKNINDVKIINATYDHLGLTPTKAMTGQDVSINRLVDVRDMTLFPGNPKVNETHLKLLTGFLNTMLAQARAGQHMVWKDRLFTPTELAYFIQQYIVQIHAFYDGNGRTSRFWQDTILALFDMPYGASGDLTTNDMLMSNLDNYQLGLSKSYHQLGELDNCLTEEYPRIFSWKRKNIRPADADQSKFSYNCRILKAN